MEVCQGIQINDSEVLIFGGCDIQNSDLKYSYILNVDTYKLRWSGDLAKPSVFVAQPFLYGNNVYALGNNYYVKNRSIHCYDIET